MLTLQQALKDRLPTMSKASPLLALPRTRSLRNQQFPIRTPITLIRNAGTATKDWEGRQSHEHITNQDDNLNIQSSASKAGKSDRTAGGEGKSGATTQEDKGNQNEQAKKDHPEAPGPVIGMNDERGGVSLSQAWAVGHSLMNHVRLDGS